jgi:seryl-tRNA(Sec) selenium transferase
MLTILATRETSRRAAIRATEMESALHDTQTKLTVAEADAKEAQELARIAHLAALPRTITPEQRATLIAALSTAPLGKIIVKANMLDSEAETYANQIKEALAAAGAEIVELGYTGIVSLHKQGGAILVRDPNRAPPYILHVQESLARIGLDFPVAAPGAAQFPEDTIIVWVSRK